MVDLFDVLVRRHLANLEVCKPYINNGRIISPKYGGPIPEGKENDFYDGLLILKNGLATLDALVRDEWVDPNDIDGFYKVPDKTALLDYLDMHNGSDGAFVFDSADMRITWVYELNNNINISIKTDKANGERSVSEMLPTDFVFYGSKQPVRRKDIGTKTSLALKFVQMYPHIEAYQIKKSAYTNLGMGKVTCLNFKGLKQEFFFKDEGDSILGVERNYRNGFHDYSRKKERAQLTMQK